MAAPQLPVKLSEAVAEYLGALGSERGLARNTVSAYRRDLRPYVEVMGDRGRQDVAAITPRDVAAYVRDLSSVDLAPASIARKVSAVRGLHRFLLTEDLVSDDPTSSIETPRRLESLPKALSVEDIEALLDAPNGALPLGVRDVALLEFLYASGARVSEAVDLDIIDVDLDNRVAVVTGKGDRQRVVPIGRPAVSAISTYLPVRMDLIREATDPDRLFLNSRGGGLTRQAVWQIVRKHARTAGLDAEHVSPHVLRHSAATHMVEGGADLRTVQEMLGHASISTTQTYTRVSPQHLLEVYVSTHPRSR